MRKLLFLLLVPGTFVPGTLFSQNNNRLSVQTGLFHYFFDGSPVLNTQYKNKAAKPFNGLLYNSVGLQYSRKIDAANSISVEYLYFYERFYNVHEELVKNAVSNRSYNTFNITYERNLPFSTFNFTYGAGLNYRNGSESVVVNYGYFPSAGFYESLMETRRLNDLGINLRTGIEYSPKPWITLFTKFDFLGFIYLNDKKAIRELQQSYNYKDYPHRFDLSWRFGIGFNFGN